MKSFHAQPLDFECVAEKFTKVPKKQQSALETKLIA